MKSESIIKIVLNGYQAIKEIFSLIESSLRLFKDIFP